MAVVPRKRKTGIVYFVAFTWKGKRKWERIGTDRREAERMDKRRRAEVKAGTYRPGSLSVATTVRQYAETWLDARNTRTADDDARWLRTYVLAREWFADLSIVDVRPATMVRLVKELQDAIGVETERKLAPKSVANIYGALRTMFRDARIEETIAIDPCVLPRGLLARKSKAHRLPYSAADVRAVITCEDVPLPFRVWTALAFFTGMREGEVCGRKWRDLDWQTPILPCLSVETQYDGQPLKTDEPRRVPVHDELATILDEWFHEGWELAYCRKPTLDDWIVPQQDGESNHSRSTAYKAWRRALRAAGVENRSLHSTRNTFITIARRCGAREDVIERVTHNAEGSIVDGYTEWAWQPLCDAVSCFNVSQDVDTIESGAENRWRRRESKPGHVVEPGETTRGLANSRRARSATKTGLTGRADAKWAAGQHPGLVSAHGAERGVYDLGDLWELQAREEDRGRPSRAGGRS